MLEMQSVGTRGEPKTITSDNGGNFVCGNIKQTAGSRVEGASTRKNICRPAGLGDYLEIHATSCESYGRGMGKTNKDHKEGLTRSDTGTAP